MSQVLPSLLGVGICCVVPLMTFAAGVYYARYGLPVSFRWRGFGRPDDEEVL